MKKQKLAFALGGGGARGALQAGALRALLETGIKPDLLVGTSIGAVNAVVLAMYGFTPEALDRLDAFWLAAAKADLLPVNTAWLTVRVLFNRVRVYPYQGLKDFLVLKGISQDLRFGDLPYAPVIMISTDLNGRQPIYHGSDPGESVLAGLLASTALPPWVHAIESDGHYLIDGGAISNLPIEPAIRYGATEVIALGLSNPDEIDQNEHGFGSFGMKYLYTIEARQISLELELARAKNIPVSVVDLKNSIPVPSWDFSQTQALLNEGYNQTKRALDSGKIPITRPVQSWFIPLKKLLTSWGKLS